jgi:hypothetical protein
MQFASTKSVALCPRLPALPLGIAFSQRLRLKIFSSFGDSKRWDSL